jgi:hypothetical protein
VSASPRLSVTVKVKVNATARFGTVKVGLITPALLKGMAGPPV